MARRIVERLYDPTPKLVSFVDKGANKKRWVVTKRHGDVPTEAVEEVGRMARLWQLVERALGGGAQDPDGILREDVRALVFAKADFTVDTAKAWAAEHGFDVTQIDKVLDADETVHIALCGDGPGPFQTVSVGDGVQAVVSRAASVPAVLRTSPDLFDGHIHSVRMDAANNGVAESAGDPPHTHVVQHGGVLPWENEGPDADDEYCSVHAGGVVAAESVQKGQYADPKNEKYPVDTVAHVRAAWSYINMPKNQKGYTSGEVAAIKRRIIAAWKKMIDPKGPPSAVEKAVTDFDTAMAMVQIGQALPELFDLFYVAQQVISNVMCDDMIVDKADGIRGVIAGLTNAMTALVDGLPDMATKQLAGERLAEVAKRARRITLIEDADVQTAERVIAALGTPKEDHMDPKDTQKAMTDQTVNIQSMIDRLNAIDGGLTNLIKRLEAIENKQGVVVGKSAEEIEAEKAAKEKADTEKAAADKAAADAEKAAQAKKFDDVTAGLGRIEETLKSFDGRMKRVETAAFGANDPDARGTGAVEPVKPKNDAEKSARWTQTLFAGGR